MTGQKLLLYFTITIFFSLQGYAKNDLSLDDKAFICETEINQVIESLKAGAESFLFHLRAEGSKLIVENSKNEPLYFDQALVQINKFLETNREIIIPILIRGNINKEHVVAKLSPLFAKKVYIKSAGEKWPKLKALKEQHIQLVVLFEEDLSATSFQKIQEEKRYEKRFSSDPLGKMILFSCAQTNDSILLNNCFEVWNKTGRVPNFIAAPQLKRNDLKNVSDSINRTRRFHGVVYYKEALLNEIFWKHLPGVITPAQFSFPLIEESHIFTPYKYAYRISPGDVIHNLSMKDDLRVFTAYDIITDERQRYNFCFENNAENLAEPKWTSAIVKEVTFVQDEQRGSVAQFSQPNSFIDYGKENTLDFNSPISISVWVKPDSITSRYMGIIGVGTSFSLKLRNGCPDFTTATIEDYAIEKSLKIDKWNHIVVVFHPDFTVQFYINGNKENEIITSEINASSQSLVIGNNVWGEQFYGGIDELKIWNRGLSADEVAKLYHSKLEEKRTHNYAFLIAIVVVLLLVFVYLKKKHAQSVNDKQPTNNKNTDSTTKGQDSNDDDLMRHNSEQNRLSLFGTFTLKSKDQEDISSGFSPLLRQILSFIILYAHQCDNGVSVAKLTDTFWPGAPKDKAKENRRANIKKLRKALGVIEGIEMVYHEKRWYVEIDSNIFVDFVEYNKIKTIVEDQLAKTALDLRYVHQVLFLLNQGNILQNIHAEWLDDYKNKMAEEVIDLLIKIHGSQLMKNRSEDKIKLAKTMLLFDHLNENALYILIKEFSSAGKHGQAKNEYEGFSKNYTSLYGESFPVQYQDIVAELK